MQSILTRGAAIVLLALVAAGPALAGGFQVQQQGAKASGRGGAFTASADDASATYYNPAAVINLEGFNLYLGGGAVIPDVSFSGPSGSADMEDVVSYPAQAYFTAQLTDNYALAFGAWIPYELRTYWEGDTPLATYAMKTSWTSRLYNGSVVARVSPSWSLALGFEWIQFEVNDLSRAYDFTGFQGTAPPVLFPPSEPLHAEMNYVLSGGKAGANLAVHYKGEDSGYRFGASLRTRKIVHLRGRMQWSDVSEATFTPVGVPDPAADARWIDVDSNGQFDPNTEPWWITLGDLLATFGFQENFDCLDLLCPMGHAFTDSTAEMEVEIPATIQLGFGRDGQGKWDWEVDLQWTQWSKWDLVNDVDMPNGVFDQQGNFYPTTWGMDFQEEWKDTWGLSAGFDYHATESHAVRGGVMYDPSPVKEESEKPYLPDAGRLGLTAGYGFRSPGGHFALDLYGQYYLYQDTVVPASVDPNVLEGTYETSAYAFGASVGFHF